VERETGVAQKGRRHPGAETTEEMLVRLVGEQTRVIAVSGLRMTR